ncbi:hypothetical protein KBT16_10135 [Nostoc sp. CCCryo 231-06]|nr:hypothetical protein [Nostoc sp. CCCryo 231-06]
MFLNINVLHLEVRNVGFNYDLDAIFADLRKKEAESGREVVNLSRKPRITTRWSGRVKDICGDTTDTTRSLT